MRDTVYFLVFDGFADWGAALALCEVRRPGDWHVATVGFSLAPVQSMAGLTVLPELTVNQMDAQRAALFILPGGYVWESPVAAPVIEAIGALHASGVPIAGICSATVALARAGLLDRRRHTSSFPGFLASRAPAYKGSHYYVAGELAVRDGGVITAHGLGSVEFAREIIETLQLYCPSDRQHWYELFKNAVTPPWFESETAAA